MTDKEIIKQAFQHCLVVMYKDKEKRIIDVNKAGMILDKISEISTLRATFKLSHDKVIIVSDKKTILHTNSKSSTNIDRSELFVESKVYNHYYDVPIVFSLDEIEELCNIYYQDENTEESINNILSILKNSVVSYVYKDMPFSEEYKYNFALYLTTVKYNN